MQVGTTKDQGLYNKPSAAVHPGALAAGTLPQYNTIKYLLTPWSRILLEKLTGFQLVKKFPAFYGTRMFITALTSARHLSVSVRSVTITKNFSY